MKIILKKYDYLCDAAADIRSSVFVDEQGFKNEFDNIDNKAIHLVLYINNMPAAVCRYFYDNLRRDIFHIGRVAVMKEFRGMKIGEKIMQAAEAEIKKDGGKFILLSAQARVREFYNKIGYIQEGEEYYDEHCPHVKMKKSIE